MEKKKAQAYVTDEMNEISPAMLKALLQTMGLITCFPNQEVKTSVLNDSNFVTAMMYILSIVFVVLVLVTFSLRAASISVLESSFERVCYWQLSFLSSCLYRYGVTNTTCIPFLEHVGTICFSCSHLLYCVAGVYYVFDNINFYGYHLN